MSTPGWSQIYLTVELNTPSSGGGYSLDTIPSYFHQPLTESNVFCYPGLRRLREVLMELAPGGVFCCLEGIQSIYPLKSGAFVVVQVGLPLWLQREDIPAFRDDLIWKLRGSPVKVVEVQKPVGRQAERFALERFVPIVPL